MSECDPEALQRVTASNDPAPTANGWAVLNVQGDFDGPYSEDKAVELAESFNANAELADQKPFRIAHLVEV